MARTEYNKLVRDRIPEIILSKGEDCFVTEIASGGEFILELKKKLVEEAEELRTATEENIVDELADIYELIDEIQAQHGVSREMVLAAQSSKRRARGGFGKRLMLHWAARKAV